MRIGFTLFGVDVTIVDTSIPEGAFPEETAVTAEELERIEQCLCPLCGSVPEEINICCNSCRAELERALRG